MVSFHNNEKHQMLTNNEFFAEAARLKCRVLPQGDDLRVCLDTKDAEIARLTAENARLRSEQAVEPEVCSYDRCRTHGCDGACTKASAAPATS